MDEKNQDTNRLSRDVPVDTIQNDAYNHSCVCPVCMNSLYRGFEETEQYCPKCGQKLHMPAFSEAEITSALFESECDEYCT